MKLAAIKPGINEKVTALAARFDYSWEFSNGSELELNHRTFRNLKALFVKSYHSSLVTEKGSSNLKLYQENQNESN